MPDGQPAPVSHQHADDTSLHVLQPRDAQVAIVSGSESSEIAEAPSVDSLAMVPMTPGEPHAFSLRRSSREHKKPKPYYAGALAEPPDKLSSGKGLQRGFLK